MTIRVRSVDIVDLAGDGGAITTSTGVGTGTPKILMSQKKTVSWVHSDATPLALRGFRIVFFTGADPNNTANYVCAPVEVGSAERTLTKSFTADTTSTTISAAVQALYKNGNEGPWRTSAGSVVIDPDTVIVGKATDITALLNRLDAISNDDIISNDERPSLKSERVRMNIQADAAQAKAAVMSITYAALTTARNNFTTYITPIIDATGNTVLSTTLTSNAAYTGTGKTAFDNLWAEVYNQINLLLGQLSNSANSLASGAVGRLDAISNDSVVSDDERSSLKVEREALYQQVTALQTKATEMLPPVPYTALTTAWNAFTANVDPVINGTGNTAINATNWKTWWSNVYKELANLGASMTSQVSGQYEIMSSDSVLSRVEKTRVIIDWQTAQLDKTAIDARVSATGVSATAFNDAHSALGTYLNSLNPAYDDATQNTDIDSTTWNSRWKTYFNEKQSILIKLQTATIPSVKGISTSNIANLTTNSSLSTQLDGITPTTGDIFLLATQTTKSENGIYIATVTNGNNSSPTTIYPNTYTATGTGSVTNPTYAYNSTADYAVVAAAPGTNVIYSATFSGFPADSSTGGTLTVDLDTVSDGVCSVIAEYSTNGGSSWVMFGEYFDAMNHVLTATLSNITITNVQVRITTSRTRIRDWDPDRGVWVFTSYSSSANVKSIRILTAGTGATTNYALTKAGSATDKSVWSVVSGTTYGAKTYTLAVATDNGYTLTLNANQAFVLAPASASTLGGVKQGANTSIATDGTISVPSAPASDVSAWAKAATKPSYTYSEVGAASSTDSRLSDARPASDVYAWAKASTKPGYAYSEITNAAGALPWTSYSYEASVNLDNIQVIHQPRFLQPTGRLNAPTWNDGSMAYSWMAAGGDTQNRGIQFYADATSIGWRERSNNTWKRLLDTSNYTSYAPGLTGSGASGTWGINITGNAASATYGQYTSGLGSNMDSCRPPQGIQAFYQWGGTNGTGSAPVNATGYVNGFTVACHPGDPNYGFQIAQNMWDDELYFRRLANSTTWAAWRKVIDSANIGAQSVNYAATAGLAYPRVSYNDDYNGNAQLMWGAGGNAIYGTAGIYCNPATDQLYAAVVETTGNGAAGGIVIRNPSGSRLRLYVDANNVLNLAGA